MWLYKGKEVREMTDMPEGTYGFIYEVEHKPTGRKYLGKKTLLSVQNKRLGKRALEALKEERKTLGLRGKTPLNQKVVKESDWKTYYGSQKKVKEFVKFGASSDFKRTILQYVKSKKLLGYYENKLLFEKGVIEPGSTYYNDNIMARYFRRDFL